jgi:hypothetical protein
MNKAIAFLKSLRLNQILMVFLAGIVLFIGTACSQSPSTNASKTTDAPSKDGSPYRIEKNVGKHLQETYPTESNSGATNSRDLNKRADGSTPAIRANETTARSDKKLPRYVENPGKAVKITAEGTKEAAGSVGDSLNEMKEGAKRGAENLKENIKSATEDVSANVRDTVQSQS